MRSRPEHSRRIHHVSVRLETETEAPVLAMRQRSSDGHRQVCSDGSSTTRRQRLIMLVDIPQTPRNSHDGGAASADTCPVLILYDFPHLSGQPRGADGRRVPRIECGVPRLFENLALSGRQFLAALVEHSPAIGGDQSFASIY